MPSWKSPSNTSMFKYRKSFQKSEKSQDFRLDPSVYSKADLIRMWIPKDRIDEFLDKIITVKSDVEAKQVLQEITDLINTQKRGGDRAKLIEIPEQSLYYIFINEARVKNLIFDKNKGQFFLYVLDEYMNKYR